MASPAKKTDHLLDNQKQLNLVVFPGQQESSRQLLSAVGPHGRVFDLSGKNPEEINKLVETIKGDVSGQEQYFFFLSTDDLLAPGATERICAELKATEASIIYTDEDRIVGKSRYEPEFKPEWNPEYFMESNYTGRAVIFASQHIRHLNFHDFYPKLDVIGNILSKALTINFNIEIAHIPSICLHRYSESSSERFQPTQGELPCFPLTCSHPSVDILIPTRDKLEILEPCVRSILEKTAYQNFRISILDNESQEAETLSFFEKIETHPQVRVLKYPYPFNYSAINNYGANQSEADVLVLLNNDIEVINSGWLEALVKQAMRPNIGCVGAKLYYPNGWIQHAGVILGVGDIAGHSHRFYLGDSTGYMNRLVSTQRVSAVTAACLAIQKTVWNEIGGLDEENLSVAYNDVDLCLRAQEAGYHNIWTPKAELIHHESISRGQDDTPEKKKRYQKEVKYMKQRWQKQLEKDPFYHPALSNNREDFSLKS
jgi:GT2 family glycosyltransferase